MENYLTEEQFQGACTLWYWNKYRDSRLFTVDNNVSKRLPPQIRMIEGNRKKALGCRPGVSDLIFITYRISFIELKLDKGTMSAEQIKFQQLVEQYCHEYFVISPPLQNFINLIEWLLNPQISTGK